MADLSERAREYGFIISDLFGRSLSLLGEDDYRHLLKCSSIQEMVMRLNKAYPILNEEMPQTLREIEQRLAQSIWAELDEFLSKEHSGSDKDILIDFFVQYHKIQRFFCRLAEALPGSPSNTSTGPCLGDFPELKSLTYCKTFDDVRKFVLKNSGIEDFFGNVAIGSDLEGTDLQVAYLQAMASYYDHYWNRCSGRFGYFEDILKVEVDAFVLDLCMNGDPLPYIPSMYSVPGLDVNDLCKTFGLDREPSLAPDSANGSLAAAMVQRQIRVYQDSFKVFNDVSCVYAYFKLKEHEMRRILFVMESSLNGDS